MTQRNKGGIRDREQRQKLFLVEIFLDETSSSLRKSRKTKFSDAIFAFGKSDKKESKDWKLSPAL